jgi:hypothetical protein
MEEDVVEPAFAQVRLDADPNPAGITNRSR